MRLWTKNLLILLIMMKINFTTVLRQEPLLLCNMILSHTADENVSKYVFDLLWSVVSKTN